MRFLKLFCTVATALLCAALCFNSSAASEVVRMLTYNTLCDSCAGDPWRFRWNGVVNVIREKEPDIVALQEVSTRTLVQFGAEFRSEYYLASQSHAPCDATDQDFYNVILYKKTMFRQHVSEGSIVLPRVGSAPTGCAEQSNPFSETLIWGRLAFRVDLTIRDSGAAIHVYNVHYDHLHKGSTNEEAAKQYRTYSSILIRDDIASLQTESLDATTVVLGDFNSIQVNTNLPDELKPLTEDSMLENPLDDALCVNNASACVEGTFMSWYKPPRPIVTAKVDYILSSHGRGCITSSVLSGEWLEYDTPPIYIRASNVHLDVSRSSGTFPSDHRAVFCVLPISD